jgi:hypothetical protein
MSRDLLQAATDFCKNLGLVAIYCESSPDLLTRQILWRPPQGAQFEIRSGRSEEQFMEFDRSNMARGWHLLSLHINESDIFSAVWIGPEHYDSARNMLAFYGVTSAQRKPGA